MPLRGGRRAGKKKQKPSLGRGGGASNFGVVRMSTTNYEASGTVSAGLWFPLLSQSHLLSLLSVPTMRGVRMISTLKGRSVSGAMRVGIGRYTDLVCRSWHAVSTIEA